MSVLSEMPVLSEICGPALSDEPGLGALTLPGFLTQVCERHANREALYWRDLEGVDRCWTYEQMQRQSERVARALIAQGVGKDTRVGILISNRPEWIFCMFGAAMAGAVTVALSTFSTQPELKYQLQIADVEVLFIETAVASSNFIDDIHCLFPDLAHTAPGDMLLDELPFLRRVVCVDQRENARGIQGWENFLAAGKVVPDGIVRAVVDSISPVDNGLIFFSSGSTAQPKAIVQTQRAAALQCWRAGSWYQVDSSVRTWSANGFFWSGNFAMALGNTLSVGGCLVLQRYFLPDETLELLQREQVSLAFAWPHQEARLKECSGWSGADLSALVYVDSAGILATHPSVKTAWRQPNGYGMTETFTFVAGAAGNRIKDGSHGPVLPGNTIRIVDPESGEVLPLGETGEIIVKGPTLTKGYLKVAPEDIFDKDGFIHTADAGYFNEAGNLCWKGRLGDIIKTGGANVSPTEIDAVLSQHPSVQSAFTVGVEHDTLGEIVVSCVIIRPGKFLDEDSLRAFARQSLASYKVPRRVLFFTEEELPMTGSNKIRRSELSALAKRRLTPGHI